MSERTISIATSPFLIVPIFALLIIAKYSNSLAQFLTFSSTFLLLSILLPIAYIYYEIKKGNISDINITIKEQREGPYLMGILGTSLLIFAFWLQKTPKVIFILAVLLLTIQIIFYLINRLWKISAHSAAFFGSVLISTTLISPYAAILFLFLPAIMWARIKSKQHTIWQTLGSVVVVGLSTALILYIADLL